MKLSGETTQAPKTTEREPIDITPEAKRLLRSLLMEPEMRGVGYSEFIIRAVQQAAEEIVRESIDAPGPTRLPAVVHLLGESKRRAECGVCFEVCTCSTE